MSILLVVLQYWTCTQYCIYHTWSQTTGKIVVIRLVKPFIRLDNKTQHPNSVVTFTKSCSIQDTVWGDMADSAGSWVAAHFSLTRLKRMSSVRTHSWGMRYNWTKAIQANHVWVTWGAAAECLCPLANLNGISTVSHEKNWHHVSAWLRRAF